MISKKAPMRKLIKGFKPTATPYNDQAIAKTVAKNPPSTPELGVPRATTKVKVG